MVEENHILIGAIRKLALASEQSGFSVEEIIELLQTGVSVETLLDLMCCADRNMDSVQLEEQKMATQFCQKCKQAHPGQVCDYDDKGDCSETVDVDKTQPADEGSRDEDGGSFRTTH